jgi:hypothetical protein
VIDYLDRHKQEFGVEPICRVLRRAGVAIAPSTYYATKARPASARVVRDRELRDEILQARGVWQTAVELYRDQGRTTDVNRVQHQLDELDGISRAGTDK